MELKYKKIIQANYITIVDTLDASYVVDYLFSKGVMSSQHMQEVDHRLMRITRQESVRRLIRILYNSKIAKTFFHFLDAMDENGFDFLAEQIKNSTGEDVPDADLEWAETTYFDDFNDNLLLQTKLLMEVKAEMARLSQTRPSNPQPPTEPKQPPPDPLKPLREVMKKNDLSQQDVIRYLEHYVKQEDMLDGPVPNTPRNPQFAASGFTQAVTTLLANNIVKYLSTQNTTPSINIYAKTMQYNVRKVLTLKSETFKDLVTRLQIKDADSYTVLAKVLDELFRERKKTNWGRVLVVYAFCGWIAQHIASLGQAEGALAIGDFLAFYINNSTTLSKWIDENGGWDDFVLKFGNSLGPARVQLMGVMLGVGLGIGLGFMLAHRT